MRPSVCVVTSSPSTVRAFLVGHIEALKQHFEVTVIANLAKRETFSPALTGIVERSYPLVREISPYSDLKGLVLLSRFFVRERFALVHSVTPKAGLLAMSAARIARVPHRLHTFTGQVWATRQGVSRSVLKRIDRILASMTTKTLVDSRSQREFLEQESILRVGQGIVLGEGSISGVDTVRFCPDQQSRRAVRQEMGIPDRAPVFLYVGRLKRDKGVVDLAAAFREFEAAGNEGWALFVGPDEEGLGPVFEATAGRSSSRLRLVGATSCPERYMAAADVFCLPSYREGFGSVVIEAASCGIPSLASRIYGVTDAVVEGETGLLHEPGSVEQIAGLMARMANKPQFSRELGSRACQRARAKFPREVLSRELVALYRDLLP